MAKDTAINNNLNLLCAGTQLVGDIKTEGDIRVDGYVKGTISLTGRTVIGGTAHVEGSINSVEVDVAGTVVGDITASGLVSLRKESVVTGNITTPQLFVEVGSQFNGVCKMTKIKE